MKKNGLYCMLILLSCCICFSCSSKSTDTEDDDTTTVSNKKLSEEEISRYSRMIQEGEWNSIPDDAIPAMIEYAYSATPEYIEKYEKMLDGIDAYCLNNFGEKYNFYSYDHNNYNDMLGLAETQSVVDFVNNGYGWILLYLHNFTHNLDKTTINSSEKKKINELFEGEYGTYTNRLIALLACGATDISELIYDRMCIRRFGRIPEYPEI